jgi:RNA polymerase sigma-70 factor, ECF subfamily
VGGWLVQSARNRAASWLRSRAGAPRLGLAHDPPAPAREPGGQGLEQVLRAIGTLPEAYRETLVLRLVEGLTGPQIASRTGLTHGSVRVNLHRGMEMLRVALGEVWP